MKNIKSILLTSIFMFIPMALLASSTGGSLGGDLVLVTIGQQIIDFVRGPIALIIITLGLMGGAFMIILGGNQDSQGWKRIGKAVVGGSILLAGVNLVDFFFAGAVI